MRSPSTSFRELMKANPFFVPMTNRAVERASASMTVSVTTVADITPVTGYPVFGFRMW
tara:strand:+ start:426 stop:599 length:174 start_codon:yes stop_codon:yes gene_type:complete